jgi:cyanate permease
MGTDLFIWAMFAVPTACAWWLSYRRDRRDGVDRFGDPR